MQPDVLYEDIEQQESSVGVQWVKLCSSVGAAVITVVPNICLTNPQCSSTSYAQKITFNICIHTHTDTHI